MDANLNLIRGFSFFSIRPILRITPIRSPFCQLTNTRVKQDGIKKMGDRGVEGEHRGGSELTQVRYADAIDGWSTSKRLVVSFQWLMKRASCACTHARTLTHAGSKGWRRTETAARNDYIAMQARSDRAYRPVCTAIHLHPSNQAPGVTN